MSQITFPNKNTGDQFTAGNVNEIKSVVNTNAFETTPVLQELPQPNASKAGQLFWLNGTLWTYAKAGQFGTLEAGEPWPVKGYKEFSTLVSSGTPLNIDVLISDFKILDITGDFNDSVSVSVESQTAFKSQQNRTRFLDDTDAVVDISVQTTTGSDIISIGSIIDDAPVQLITGAQLPLVNLKLYPPTS